jgi:8-amino-7-oxononanoate synthase
MGYDRKKSLVIQNTLMMLSLDHFLLNRLESLKKENKFRTLLHKETDTDFSSNDYLGLARSQELHQRIINKLEDIQPIRNGATGSRLLSGNSSYIEEVEYKLAQIFKSEAALIFNSGYAANQSVLSSIPQRGDTILYDELAHACIKDGARLSMASRFSFRHNDLNDLGQKLKRAKGKIFIAVESIYSMDGDECPLKSLIQLSNQYKAFLIVDEAHSTGVVGEHGNGLAVSNELHSKIDIRIYTFGKAMGMHGACVAGSKHLIDYLINFARPFIYTTALPTHSIASIDCAFDFLKEHIHLQKDLRKNIDYFVKNISVITNRTSSNSSIQTFLVPGNTQVKRASQILSQAGLDVRPILSPTVPKGEERLRICLHSFNSSEEVSKLISSLENISKTNLN